MVRIYMLSGQPAQPRRTTDGLPPQRANWPRSGRINRPRASGLVLGLKEQILLMLAFGIASFLLGVASTL
ncbi:MAG: hypothetical protein N2561_04975 [Bacteroidetes bacterium]|nr:hypothetical protein [Rhodothermia bacterium]MCS7154500.1 hypothetical protein [Bacteroidota bacterium]MCX7906873.1 hypothetical protein [Bacteroidota bacterium]MDW8136848.1 hypothetical protein [Bacteroidota bacterium]MDW8285282.1 hypothetical protein [Bacteroidota bacterium]